MKFCTKSAISLVLFLILPSLINAKHAAGKKNTKKSKSGKYQKGMTPTPTLTSLTGLQSLPESHTIPVPNDPFYYPKDMPPPPEMWIEGFASRLHAQDIQRYETPIQVIPVSCQFHSIFDANLIKIFTTNLSP